MKKILIVIMMLSSLLFGNWGKWEKKEKLNEWNEIIKDAYEGTLIFKNNNGNPERMIKIFNDSKKGSIDFMYIKGGSVGRDPETKKIKCKVDLNDPMELTGVDMGDVFALTTFLDNNFINLLEQMKSGKVLKLILPDSGLEEIPLTNFDEVYKFVK